MRKYAGVYWVIRLRPILDPDVRRIVEESNYFTGQVMQNDEDAGYYLMQQLHDAGKNKVALVTTARLDSVGIARERGAYRAAEEFGMEIVAEIRSTTTEDDIYRAVSDVILAHPGTEAVFRVGSHVRGSAQAAIRAITDSPGAGDIRFVTIDISEITPEDFDSGVVLAAMGAVGPLDSSIATAILVNAITGVPLDPDGPSVFAIDYLAFHSSTELLKYNQFFDERQEVLFSEDEVRKSCSGSSTPI